MKEDNIITLLSSITAILLIISFIIIVQYEYSKTSVKIDFDKYREKNK